MKLENVLIFFKNHAFPKGTSFLYRFIVLKDIVAVVLHEADMCLIEVLTVIFEQDEEDTIVIDSPILQKHSPLLVMCNLGPELLITLACLPIPLSISPRVPQFQHANVISFHIFKLRRVNLYYPLYTSVYACPGTNPKEAHGISSSSLVPQQQGRFFLAFYAITRQRVSLSSLFGLVS